MSHGRRLAVLLSLLVAAQLASFPVRAETEEKPVDGRPTVHLDKLTLPAGLADARRLEQHLRLTLKKAARRANWGAGRDNRIEYRFEVTELRVVRDGDILRVHCAASGRLPGGERAKSELGFGGDPNARDKLVRDLLDMVANGVVTRLAELERKRLR